MDSARIMAARRAATVRWDRVGRIALLLLLGVVLLLYVNPAINYVRTWQAAGTKHDEVSRLRAENKRLRARRAALEQPSTLEHEARALGMVKPGERAYLIRGLPRSPKPTS
ncbi:MAG TPA: septum formation initiator family protein [Solirubrobacteraceae bacterium]|jgi:cell division protein FtsB|nr:septum formation initiator family protein [Solirubrobacteraceae bacterium]